MEGKFELRKDCSRPPAAARRHSMGHTAAGGSRAMTRQSQSNWVLHTGRWESARKSRWSRPTPLGHRLKSPPPDRTARSPRRNRLSGQTRPTIPQGAFRVAAIREDIGRAQNADGITERTPRSVRGGKPARYRRMPLCEPLGAPVIHAASPTGRAAVRFSVARR